MANSSGLNKCVVDCHKTPSLVLLFLCLRKKKKIVSGLIVLYLMKQPFSFRMALHRDIVNVQVEMLRQFQIQQVSGNMHCIINYCIMGHTYISD